MGRAMAFYSLGLDHVEDNNNCHINRRYFVAASCLLEDIFLRSWLLVQGKASGTKARRVLYQGFHFIRTRFSFFAVQKLPTSLAVATADQCCCSQ
jgi:hypothetical protein